MEGKIKTKPINGTKTIQENKELKYYHNKEPKNRIFFNAVTGQEINLDCENEEEMYELSPDIENYNEDKINNCSDLNDKDKLFFQTWNNIPRKKRHIHFIYSIINIIIFIAEHSKKAFYSFQPNFPFIKSNFSIT